MDVLGYTSNGDIRIDLDGMTLFVPDNMGDAHRRLIAEWEASGNTIPPYVPPLPTVDDYKLAIVSMLDAKAQERRYDSAVSISTYVGSTNAQWAAEAQAYVAWRDAVWAYTYAELDKVLSGQRPQPTVEAFLGELPTMVWPA